MPYHYKNKVDCSLCGKSKSISNYSKHLKICKGKPLLPPYRLLDYPLTFDKPMYHVIYRTDCLASFDDAEFLSNWDIYNNIHAYCGAHNVKSVEIDSKTIFDSSTKHPHAHFIGTWANTKRVKDSKYLTKFFTIRSAFKCINLLKEKKQLPTAPYIHHFRILQTIFYIQTVNGKHAKTNHMNPITFANEYYRKKYIKDLATKELWIIHQYKEFLESLLNKLYHLRLAIAQDPETYPPSMLKKGKIKMIECKIVYSTKVIEQLIGHNCPTDDDILESYNKYIQPQYNH